MRVDLLSDQSDSSTHAPKLKVALKEGAGEESHPVWFVKPKRGRAIRPVVDQKGSQARKLSFTQCW